VQNIASKQIESLLTPHLRVIQPYKANTFGLCFILWATELPGLT